MFRFHKGYFLLTLLLLLTEILIALYLHDPFIRPYFGDYLVVILLYCCCQSFFKFPVVKLAVAVLIFSFLIEISQYFQLVRWLGLEHSTLAKVVLGSSFAWSDLLAYTLGIITVLMIEKYRSSKV